MTCSNVFAGNMCVLSRITIIFIPRRLIDNDSALVPDNRLASVRYQVITWTNDDPDQWRVYEWVNHERGHVWYETIQIIEWVSIIHVHCKLLPIACIYLENKLLFGNLFVFRNNRPCCLLCRCRRVDCYCHSSCHMCDEEVNNKPRLPSFLMGIKIYIQFTRFILYGQYLYTRIFGDVRSDMTEKITLKYLYIGE